MEFKFNDTLECIDVFDDDGAFVTELYSLEVAEQALASLEAAVAQMREFKVKYVQVRFDLGRNSMAQAYTYIDPSGTLKKGDLVQAPVYDGQLQTAKVVGLGRGSWKGRCKAVAAKLEAQTL